jgi:hypothetical protein
MSNSTILVDNAASQYEALRVHTNDLRTRMIEHRQCVPFGLRGMVSALPSAALAAETCQTRFAWRSIKKSQGRAWLK